MAADPGLVYDLVADVARVPELSPEVRTIEWLGDDRRSEPGASFRGRTRYLGVAWWRTVKITEATRGEVFAFETVPGRGIYNDSTRWRYVFEPTETGTRVTESYDFVASVWLRAVAAAIGRPLALRRGIRRTLDALRSEAEST